MAELIWYEIKKVWKLRFVSYTLLCLLILPGIFFMAEVCLKHVGDAFSPSEYRRLISDMDKTRLTQEADALHDVYNAMLLEGTQPAHMYTGNLRSELFLYEQVQAEIEQVAGYQDYLEQIKRAYEKQSSVSLFQNSKSDQANAAKTAADFANMEDVQTQLAGTYGVNLLMKTDFWTISMVFVVFILTAGLLSNEIEGHGVQLLRCTVKGKKSVIYAKYLAGIGMFLLYLLLTFLCRLIVVGITYGCTAWTASFQSVYGAMSCTLKISIWHAVFLFAMYKLIAVLFLYTFFFFLLLFFQRTVWLYLAGLGIVLAGYALYNYIDASSWLAKLKWLNPTAFLYTDSLLMEYKNISFLGQPVCYRHIVAGISILAVVICLIFSGKLFTNIKPIQRHTMPSNLYAAVERGVRHLTGGDSLTGFESRKWSFYQGGIFICILLAAGIVFFSPPVSEQLYTKEEIYYKYYVKQIEGAFSWEKLDVLYEELAQLQELEARLSEEKDSYTEAAFLYYSRELNKKDGLSAVIQYGEYLRENSGSFVYEQGYEMLLGKKNGAGYMLAYRTISLLVMVLLSGMVWGMERRSGMKAVLHVSFLGEKRIDAGKCRNIFLIGVIVAALTYLPWIGKVLHVFGAQMINEPACSMQMLHWFPACISIFHVVILFYLLHVVYLWLTGIILKQVERMTKNVFLSQMIVFVTGMIPVFLLAINA